MPGPAAEPQAVRPLGDTTTVIRGIPRWLVSPLGLCLLTASATDGAASQQPNPPSYDSRFVEANGARLQYMDFGGSGQALIFVQDVHNIFEDEDPYFRDIWAAFYARFVNSHHVLATVRRGYGDSESPGWGYDVPTQSEDLLGLMDGLGISQAVLFGRTTAVQDMVWIAEHHPDRVAGLIMLGNPPVFGPREHADAQRFDDLYSLASCDLQERASALLDPRASWRPHFLSDSLATIAVAALRFHNPAYDRQSMSLRRLDRLEETLSEAASGDISCPGEVPFLAFADSLARDPQRRADVRRAFESADRSVAVDDGLARAFGARLTTVPEPEALEGWADYFDFMFPHVQRFLESRWSTSGGR